ncbi:MarR family winged helix-turn-helix transcriptional regulator [Actinoplanes sp. OR16]|uniref:MarR family winged helix-turn-helix transcriptional regulator n=1 Tax=Actinoplanes sp. OR16 TaxID=946334 RepID=UPI001E3A8CB0|nr:MarR family winged helix-turn-helix transcriptional regulator [Actinoplanes sp. OR16]
MTSEQQLLDAVGGAFARMRRRTMQAPVSPPPDRKDLTRNLVLNLVEEAEADDREVTVGNLADQLGVDPSVASRMASDCITHGYLLRAASQQDGRRTIVRLTDDGRALMDRFRRQYRQAFEFVTRDWPEGERLELARLLVKYADSASRLPLVPERGDVS